MRHRQQNFEAACVNCFNVVASILDQCGSVDIINLLNLGRSPDDIGGATTPNSTKT